jgi:FAD/FMN-containing dehydrogenase
MLVTDSLTLQGTVLTPTSPGYDDARTIWNGAIDRRPALIARCRTADDVAAAVRHARDHGLEISVRGGGHAASGHAVVDEGLMIDLSRMKRVDVDAPARVACVEPGVLLGELDRATQKFGLAVPAGTVSHTGVAGLTLGGGVGWLQRKHGLTIDSLLEVELVTAEGEIVRAGSDENDDLFWAVRGAGANFGVVTEFVFRLREVGPLVVGGMLVFPFEQAAEVMCGARDVLTAAPDELTTALALVTLPPHEPFPQELWGQKALGIVPAYSGDIDAGLRTVELLRALAEPALDLVGPMPFVALQSMLDATAPHGLHNYNAAETLPDLTGGAIDSVLEAFAGVPSARSHVILTQMGGAVGRVGTSATAFAQRDAGWLAWIIGIWDPTEPEEPNVAWARASRRALEPFATAGTYVNALEPEAGGNGRLRASYGPNWDRLVELKRRWDPENVFRLNQNIPPASPR